MWVISISNTFVVLRKTLKKLWIKLFYFQFQLFPWFSHVQMISYCMMDKMPRKISLQKYWYVIRLQMLLLQHFHDTCSIFKWQKELCTMTWKMFTGILENEIYISLKHQNDWESIFDTIAIILSADQFIIMIIMYRRFLFWP